MEVDDEVEHVDKDQIHDHIKLWVSLQVVDASFIVISYFDSLTLSVEH